MPRQQFTAADHEFESIPTEIDVDNLPDEISQLLGEVWTDELPAYQAMDHDHRTVLHDEEYVSEEGVHTNQAECLWSLLQPWLAKFRGLSSRAWSRPLEPTASSAH